MHNISTNSSPRIFLHQFQTINHKCSTQYSRNNFKEPKRETNYAKHFIYARGQVIWSSFLNETEKNILSQHFFKSKIKENWAPFKYKERMKQHLKTKEPDDKDFRLSASSCQQQFLYLYVIPPCKWSYKEEVILNLKVSYVYCISFIITIVYFWQAK